MFYITQQSQQAWKSDLNQIPFDYFLNNEFYLKCLPDYFNMSILAILPKLLKQRFPNCKVYVINNTDEYEKYDAVFGDNSYIDEILFDKSHDFYFLNTVPKNLYPNLTYEDLLIKDMLYFWKFDYPYKPEELVPEIYFNQNDIDYIQELNQSWCNGEEYSIINGIFEHVDQINEILKYNNCEDYNILFQHDKVILQSPNDSKYKVDATEFIIPDKIKLGLIKFAKINIGYENDYFNLMRKENSIYIIDSKNNLKNIHYIKSK